jgi:phosphopentomutase
MDSFGVGESLDADRYGDRGADTFGNIFTYCQEAFEKKERQTPLQIPNLIKYGLIHLHTSSTAKRLIPIKELEAPQAMYGYAVEQSFGKDTPSGHFELAGVPVLFDWGYFKEGAAGYCFPPPLIDALIQQANLPGVLGLKAASGTDIIKELGKEHIKSGKPIVYTSADSVLQIAAHEEHFGLERLYALSELARTLVDDYNIGRVIARPFIGEQADDFKRTYNRRDYAMPPPEKTLLDYLKEAGHQVISIGKINDIYAGCGITKCVKAGHNQELFDKTLEELKTAAEGCLIFTNFVDFDSQFGHRRDVLGYAEALEAFDKRLTQLEQALRADDLVILAADHGCDPTFPGSDHTREHIPVIAFGPKIKSKFIGRRESFADIGQSIAKHLGISPLQNGLSFL